MKKFLIFPLLLVTLIAAAQTVPDDALSRSIREVPQRASTNLHAYEFAPVVDTPAPKGYKPFYISYYGRHGSRSNSDGKQYLRLQKGLLAAQKDGQLTPDGELLLSVTERVIKGHDGMNGHLTPRGRREHATIAERMYRRYPDVFRKGSKKICAISSTVPRCIISMTAFTNRLMTLQKDLDIDIDTGENFMKYIGRGDTQEIRDRNKPILDSLYKTFPKDSTSFLPLIFKDPGCAHQYFPSVYKLEKDIYATAKSTDAFDIEENLFRFVPEQAVYNWSNHTGMYIYLNHANSLESGDIRVPRASRLAADIISRADEVIAGAPRAADLRFGHDWPLVGLFCYLGLEGVSERMSLEQASGKWVAAIYTPFAGNLQIIFYRNKKQDILVKFLMNEKETLIPELTAVEGPYYRWSDVKAMCAQRKQL